MKLPRRTGFANITEANTTSAMRDYIKPGLVFIMRADDKPHWFKIRSVSACGMADCVTIDKNRSRVCRSVRQSLLAKAFVAGRLTIFLGREGDVM
jgi:hypothetical protein